MYNACTSIFLTPLVTVFPLPYVLSHLLTHKLTLTDIWMHTHCWQPIVHHLFLLLIVKVLYCDFLLSLFSILSVAVVFPYLLIMRYFSLAYLLLNLLPVVLFILVGGWGTGS